MSLGDPGTEVSGVTEYLGPRSAWLRVSNRALIDLLAVKNRDLSLEIEWALPRNLVCQCVMTGLFFALGDHVRVLLAIRSACFERGTGFGRTFQDGAVADDCSNLHGRWAEETFNLLITGSTNFPRRNEQ